LNFLRGLYAFVPFTWYWTGPLCPLKLFSIVCVSKAQTCYSSILFTIASSFSSQLFFHTLFSFSFSFLTSNCLLSFFPPTYFTHQTHSDGITPSPFFFLPIPFFSPTCKAATEQCVQIVLAFVLFSHKYIPR